MKFTFFFTNLLCYPRQANLVMVLTLPGTPCVVFTLQNTCVQGVLYTNTRSHTTIITVMTTPSHKLISMKVHCG